MKNHFLVIFIFLYSLSASAQISFTNLPNQPSDNIISIVTDPTNNDIYAAATLKVIRSVNNGTSYILTANTGAQNLNLIYFTAAGQLYAGADKTNTSAVGLVQYNKATNVWSEVLGSPQNITAIVEDNTGNLILGTGSTGNYTASNPINKGNGFYYYNIGVNTFTAINSGLPNVPTYTVFPFIKSLVKNSTGLIFAGTYGNGVLKWNGTVWSSYGSGLANNNISSLKLNTNDSLYAGTDVGIHVISTAGITWSTVSTGMPANKPVRSITIDAAGKLYAGLGFYHYQLGNMAGDIYTSVNNGTNWQNANTGYVGGVIYAMLAHASGNIFAGSAGIWKSANSGGLWGYAMSGVKIANQTIKMVENAAGDMFVLCRNNLLGTRLPFGGVFRSTDKGVTWVQIVNGISGQALDELFADGQNNIWVSGKVFKSNANGSGTVWGTPELYKSTNNGNTWVKNTSIVTASDSYNYIAETKTGKLYVASSFGTGQTNLSSSTDYNTFDNTLSLPPTNGNHSFGLVVNNNNDVFHGTETAGLKRSVTNGAAGSFTTVTVTGANTSVNIDSITQNIYCNVGNVLTPNVNLYCSTNNGNSFFPLNNFPQIWANADDMVFTNTGKIYTIVNSSHFNQVGLYLSQSPITTNSAYTMLINFGTLSFYFNSLYIDKCGYLYGIAQGGGISVSTLPVNTPLQSTLNLPANNVTGVSLAPTLTWSPVCTPDSFRVQIALDTFFTGVIIDQALITTTNYNVVPGILNPNTKYFWRVYAVNAAGVGKWSTVNSFTTLYVLPVTFISFEGSFDISKNNIELTWVTTNEINARHFIIERSAEDNIAFFSIGILPASVQPVAHNNYTFSDQHPLSGKRNLYRIKEVDVDGKFTYSKTISVSTIKSSPEKLIILSNPITNNQFIVEYNGSKVNKIKLIAADAKQTTCSFTTQSNNRIKVNLPPAIAKGTYVLQLNTDGGMKNIMVVIQ
jgi:hypothetical protein